MFYTPRMLVMFALLTCLKGEPRGRTRYVRTMPLRRRVRRGFMVWVARIDGAPVPVIP
jgi:hypothetical protein